MAKPSFNEVAAEYRTTIQNHVKASLKDQNSVEDVTQDVFLAAHKNWEKFDETRESVLTWLRRIANHLIIHQNKPKPIVETELEP